MKRDLTFARLLIVAGALGLLALPVAAQQIPDGLGVVDKDFGMKLRHPAAYRGELNVYPRVRAERVTPRWEYRFFDHPTPSFSFFQQGQTLKQGMDFFPGLERNVYNYGWPPAYYPSYYGYDPYYAPPCRRAWGHCRRW
ncbi:MAG: hypothetical protein FJX75_00600 [Armatimonadetes bacterium]|nr:hypothetical protein [Armatimonadota bacterium]